MSQSTPFIVLPTPRLRNGRFEYQIPDLVQSFETAQAMAKSRLSSSEDKAGITRRHAALSAIFAKSGEIVAVLAEAAKNGSVAVSATAMIADGVRPLEGQPNNTFLEQLRRHEIEFVTEERMPA